MIQCTFDTVSRRMHFGKAFAWKMGGKDGLQMGEWLGGHPKDSLFVAKGFPCTLKIFSLISTNAGFRGFVTDGYIRVFIPIGRIV